MRTRLTVYWPGEFGTGITSRITPLGKVTYRPLGVVTACRVAPAAGPNWPVLIAVGANTTPWLGAWAGIRYANAVAIASFDEADKVPRAGALTEVFADAR